MWKPFLSRHVLKTLSGSLKGKSLKRTISASGGFGLLQIVSEPNTGRCASEEAEPKGGGHEVVCQLGRWSQRGVD